MIVPFTLHERVSLKWDLKFRGRMTTQGKGANEWTGCFNMVHRDQESTEQRKSELSFFDKSIKDLFVSRMFTVTKNYFVMFFDFFVFPYA